MNQTRIRLFGGFLVEHDGRALPPIPSTTARSLFAYLVTFRDRRHTRDLLAGTFWPDRPESTGRRRLSQALWQLQTALLDTRRPGISIEATASDVTLVAGDRCWVDVAAFEQHLANASGAEGEPHRRLDELETGVALYRGEFLAGFYDDWALGERDRLHGEYLGALQSLVSAHKARSDYGTALSFARRLTLHNPLHEGAHREVMRLCFLLGRTNEALQQYERCETVLMEELGAEPALETRELRASILQAREKGERPFAPDVRSPLHNPKQAIPLVGRDAERATVLRRLEETLRGAGGAVLVEGSAGIGKTRFLQEVASDAAWRGLSVLRAEAKPEDEFVPYSGLRDALQSGLTRLRTHQLDVVLHDAVLRDLIKVVPSIGRWLTPTVVPDGTARGEAQHRIGHSLQQVLVGLAELNPSVLIVDDAHWADQATVDLLVSLAPELHRSGLLLCLGYRSTEAREREGLWTKLRTIDSVPRTDRVQLVSLELPDVARLVEQSLGGAPAPGDMVEGLYLETGGNPLFILETMRTWHEQTQTQMTSDAGLPGVAETAGLPMSGGVSQALTRRLGGLDDRARSILEIVAVQREAGEPSVVAEIAGLPVRDVLTALETMLRRGILVETEAGYGFAHHQMRRAALGILDPERERSIHAEVAAAMRRDSPQEVEQLAHHYLAAGDKETAAIFAYRAGRRAMALSAYETAVHHFGNATELDGPERFAMLLAWEESLSILGRRDEQGRVLKAMEGEASTPSESALAAARRSRFLATEARFHEAIPLARRALTQATGPGSDRDTRIEVRQILGMVLARSGRPGDAIPHLRDAAASTEPDSPGKAWALCDLGNVLCEVQEYGAASTQLTRALEIFERVEDPYGVAEASGQLAIVEMEQGNPGRAGALYRKAVALSGDVGYRRGEAAARANLGNALYVQGSIVEALAEYDRAADLFDAVGDRRGAALLRANAASVRFTILGDDAVERDVEASRQLFHAEGHKWGEAFCHEHLGALALRRGDAASARGHVDRGLRLLGDGSHRWVEVHLRRLGAVVSLEAGDPERARSEAKAALDTCVDLGLDDVAPTIKSVLAAARRALGDFDGALELARDATDTLRPGSEQPYLVWYRHHLAAAAAGREDEAASALGEAVRRLDAVLEPLDRDTRHAAIARVPEHRGIYEARERFLPVWESVALPMTHVPLGRPLRREDMITICWSTSEPGDTDIANAQERRRLRIRRMAQQAADQGAAPRIDDIAHALSVSVATVRRDLAALRRSGVFVSTRGSR